MPAGRPSKYDPAFVKQALSLCMLGATNDDLARAFGVSPSSIDKWIAEIPEFSSALKQGREIADATVASRLYSRACGYEHEAVKIVADAKTGAEHIVPYIERYPPDTTAAIFWLKNRRPDLWRDVRHNETTIKREPADLTDAELADIAASGGERIAAQAPSKGEPRKLH